MKNVLARIPLLVILSGLVLVVFGATGFAADVATPAGDNTSLLDLLKPVVEAFSGGHYAYAAALGTIVIVALIKRYAGDKYKWFHSDAGGTALALLGAMGAAMAASLGAPGASVTLGMLKSALLVGVGAAGGFAVIKALIIEPLIKPLEAKAPAWSRPIFDLILWIFDKPDAVKQAEAAGAAATAAAPAQGTAAVAGTPTEVK